MRAVLREWYPLDEDERSKILNDSVITFDTNALLSLYRLGADDRGKVVELLSELSDRLWLAYRAAFEFQRSRLGVYREQLRAYDDVTKAIQQLRNRFQDSASSHPVLARSDVRREINDRLAGIQRFIVDKRDEFHPDDLSDPHSVDGVRSALDEVFAGKVGSYHEPTRDELADAKQRFERKVPPGYEDAKKPVPDCYGDLFIWLEVMNHASSTGSNPCPLLFVTEERKADWWLIDDDGSRIGPRPELTREAFVQGISPFQMLSLSRFYSLFAQHLGWAVTELGEFSPVSGSANESDGVDIDPLRANDARPETVPESVRDPEP